MKKIKFIISILLIFAIISPLLPNEVLAVNVGETTTVMRTWLSSYGKYDMQGSGLASPYNRGWADFHYFTASDGQIAYCIEYLTDHSDTTGHTAVNTYAKLSAGQQQNLKYALMYGYTDGTSGISGYDKNIQIIATQLMVWLICGNYYNTSQEEYVLNYFTRLTSYKSLIKDVYYKIKSDMIGHGKKPSFDSATYILNDNGDGTYSVNLTDTNGVLSEYEVVSSGDFTVFINGNDLTIVAYSPDAQGEITFRRKNYSSLGLLFLNAGSLQDKVTFFQADDPITSVVYIGSIPNEPRPPGLVSPQKYDSETGSPIYSAYYEVYDETGSYVDSVSAFSTLTLAAGNYTMYEAQAPYGYYNGNGGLSFTIYEEETQTLFFYNTPQKATISVDKKGEALVGFDKRETDYGEEYTPIYEEQSLDGATYEIYAMQNIYTADGTLRYSKDQLVDTITTTDGQKAVSIPLYLGRYLVREVTAPTGYFLGANEYEVVLEYQGQHILLWNYDLESYNERQKLQVMLQKGIQMNWVYPDPFAYESIVFGIFTQEPIFNSKGDKLIDKDMMVDILYLNKDYLAVSSTDLPFGKFYVKELQTAIGYVLNTKKFPFEWNPREQTIPFVEMLINENNGEIKEKYESIYNYVIKGWVDLIKRSNLDNRILQGAVYGVYSTYDTLVDTLETDENGYAKSDPLPFGLYYIQEIVPPRGYKIDYNKYWINISYHHQTIEIDVYNEPLIGAIIPCYKATGGSMFEDSWVTGNPQTGDNIMLDITALLLLCFLSMASLLYLLSRKEEKYETK